MMKKQLMVIVMPIKTGYLCVNGGESHGKTYNASDQFGVGIWEVRCAWRLYKKGVSVHIFLDSKKRNELFAFLKKIDGTIAV